MQVLVIGQGHWGKGPDLKTARKMWLRQGAELGKGYTVLTFQQDDAVQSISAWGDVSYQGAEPEVREVPAR